MYCVGVGVVVVGCVVWKVELSYVYVLGDDFFEYVWCVGGGVEGGDDFGMVKRSLGYCVNLVEVGYCVILYLILICGWMDV